MYIARNIDHYSGFTILAIYIITPLSKYVHISTDKRKGLVHPHVYQSLYNFLRDNCSYKNKDPRSFLLSVLLSMRQRPKPGLSNFIRNVKTSGNILLKSNGSWGGNRIVYIV